MRVDIHTKQPNTRVESPYISDASNKLLEGYMRLCAQSNQKPPSLACGSKKLLSGRNSMTISSKMLSSKQFAKETPKEVDDVDHMVQYRMSKASYDAMESLANSLNSASHEERSLAPVQIVVHKFETPRTSFTNKQPFSSADINDSDTSDYGSPVGTSHARSAVRQHFDDNGLTLHAPKTHRDHDVLDSPLSITPRHESPTQSPATSPRAGTELDCSLWFRNFSKKCALHSTQPHEEQTPETSTSSPQREPHEMHITLPNLSQAAAPAVTRASHNSPRSHRVLAPSSLTTPNTKEILASYGVEESVLTSGTPAPDEDLPQPSFDDSYDSYDHTKRGLIYNELSLDESVNNEAKTKKKFAFVQKLKITPHHGIYTPKQNLHKNSPSKRRAKKVAVDIPHLIDSASLCVSITSNDSINSLSSFRKVPAGITDKYATAKNHGITAAVPKPPQFAIASTRATHDTPLSPVPQSLPTQSPPKPSPRVRIVHSDGSVSYASQDKLANRMRQRSPQRLVNWETSQRMNYKR